MSSHVFRCDRVRVNGKIVEYFFSRRSADQRHEDEHVILNINGDGTEYEEGKFYIVPPFEPATPR